MTLIDLKKRFLAALYDIHEDFCDQQEVYACRKGCDACCTRNVTMTTLEGAYLLERLETTGQSQVLSDLTSETGEPGFRPLVTINKLADLCKHDRDLPDERIDPQAGPCALLKNQCCSIYPVRPLACRAMLSKTACASTGEADMPEIVLSANTILAQYLEAVDQPGFTGNMADIVLYLRNPVHRQCYLDQQPGMESNTLLPNMPLPALMAPPEHSRRLQPMVHRVREIIQQLFC